MTASVEGKPSECRINYVGTRVSGINMRRRVISTLSLHHRTFIRSMAGQPDLPSGGTQEKTSINVPTTIIRTYLNHLPSSSLFMLGRITFQTSKQRRLSWQQITGPQPNIATGSSLKTISPQCYKTSKTKTGT